MPQSFAKKQAKKDMKKQQKQQHKQKQEQRILEVPDNFKQIINDFSRDLLISFPELAPQLQKWTEDIPQPVLIELFEYMASVYPERFFDILYQNDELFSQESDSNVHFFPEVDFRQLYHSEGVSETIRTAIWKYLQLMLMTIIASIKDKSHFGDAASMFDGVDEDTLQEKLAETVGEIGKFFQDLGISEEDIEESSDSSPPHPSTGSGSASQSMPSAEALNDHLKGLFDGKIGTLAKELAEELASDMSDMFGTDGNHGIKTTQDLIKSMMKNPKKIMSIMQKIGTKFNEKMKKGEITQEELMKEAGELMNKMKDLGGGKDEFTSMFQNIAKGMGGKMNMGAFNNMSRKFATKERLATKLEQKREKTKTPPESAEIKVSENGNLVFSVKDDTDVQEKSTKPTISQNLDDLAKEIEGDAKETKKNKKKAK